MNFHKHSVNPRLNDLLLRFYHRSWFRTLLQPFLRVPVGKKYVFIVGCYSSGTTLLDYILSEHGEISNLPTEGVAITGELLNPEAFGWNRMWCMCRDKLEICTLEKKPDVKLIKKDWGCWFDPKKELWLEKSIINSLNIDCLEEKFDSPFFIWIVRNGYAVAEGIRRRTIAPGRHPVQYTEGYPIEMCAKQWVESNQVIERKLLQTKHWKKVTYEALTSKPYVTLQRILEWLPVKSSALNFPERFTFHNRTREILDMNSESISRLTAKEIDDITGEASDELLRHGYPLLRGKV